MPLTIFTCVSRGNMVTSPPRKQLTRLLKLQVRGQVFWDIRACYLIVNSRRTKGKKCLFLKGEAVQTIFSTTGGFFKMSKFNNCIEHCNFPENLNSHCRMQWVCRWT